LAGYDALLGCGAAPAFIHKAGLRLDMFLSYGSDLYQLPFRNPERESSPDFEVVDGGVKLSEPPYWLDLAVNANRDTLNWLRYHRAQAEGLGRTRRVVSRHPRAAAILEKCGFSGELVGMDLPMIFTPELTSERLGALVGASPASRRMAELRASHSLVVFHHARQIWSGEVDAYSGKGNDVLIRGFAQHVRQGGEDSRLVMLEYGPDVEASRRLVEELGIGPWVEWLPCMPRKDVMLCLSQAHMAGSEFAFGWLTGGCMFEPLAVGAPLLGYRDDARYAGAYPELYPMINARTSDQVAEAFLRFRQDPAEAAAIGAGGRRWLERYVMEGSVAKLMAFIDESVV
jgi:hypothetical protein